MRRRIVLGLVLGACILGPVTAVADSATETYELVITLPNMGEAPNGDRVAITGTGTFSVNPKTVMDMAGNFTHTDKDGAVLGAGTWEATELLAFQLYGCGIVTFPEPDVILPANFCGGALKMQVVLTTPVGQLDGILTVFCIVGPNPPNSHDEPSEEGVTLNVIGEINFNHVAPGGQNIYIRTSP